MAPLAVFLIWTTSFTVFLDKFYVQPTFHKSYGFVDKVYFKNGHPFLKHHDRKVKNFVLDKFASISEAVRLIFVRSASSDISNKKSRLSGESRRNSKAADQRNVGIALSAETFCPQVRTPSSEQSGTPMNLTVMAERLPGSGAVSGLTWLTAEEEEDVKPGTETDSQIDSSENLCCGNTKRKDLYVKSFSSQKLNGLGNNSAETSRFTRSVSLSRKATSENKNCVSLPL